MMKSPFVSVSAVLVVNVMQQMPDTEAPKWVGGLPAGWVGVVSTNWSAVERGSGEGKGPGETGHARDQVGGARAGELYNPERR